MPEATLAYPDLAAMPDDGRRRELLGGELFVSPSPRTRHQRIARRLLVAIASHLEGGAGGEIFAAPFDVLLSQKDVVQPDLVFVAADRAGIVTDDNIQGVPTLIVEILSDPRTDRVRKRDLYGRSGVPEYWIVDPDADRIEVYRLDEDRYGKPVIVEPGDTLATDTIPGLNIDVADLLRR